MIERKQNITRSIVSRQTHMAERRIRDTLERAKNIETDPDKSNRLKKGLCICCHYLANHRIGGASMTTRPCGLCETTMQFSSTATDVICTSCSHEQGLCKQCGADIELKHRRKKYKFEIVN